MIQLSPKISTMWWWDTTLISSHKDLYCSSSYTEAITKIWAVISQWCVQLVYLMAVSVNILSLKSEIPNCLLSQWYPAAWVSSCNSFWPRSCSSTPWTAHTHREIYRQYIGNLCLAVVRAMSVKWVLWILLTCRRYHQGCLCLRSLSIGDNRAFNWDDLPIGDFSVTGNGRNGV